MGTWNTWPQSAEIALRKMWSEGISSGIISKRLTELGHAYTRNAIIGKVDRLGLESRKTTVLIKRRPDSNRPLSERLSPEEVASFKSQYLAGDPVQSMADKYGVAFSSVTRFARKLGLAPRDLKASMARYYGRRTRPNPKKAEPAAKKPEVYRLPRERAPPPNAVPVTLLDATPWQCKFPLGEPCGPQTLYCGAPATHDAYCLYHAQITHGIGTPFERAAVKKALRVPLSSRV